MMSCSLSAKGIWYQNSFYSSIRTASFVASLYDETVRFLEKILNARIAVFLGLREQLVQFGRLSVFLPSLVPRLSVQQISSDGKKNIYDFNVKEPCGSGPLSLLVEQMREGVPLSSFLPSMLCFESQNRGAGVSLHVLACAVLRVHGSHQHNAGALARVGKCIFINLPSSDTHQKNPRKVKNTHNVEWKQQ